MDLNLESPLIAQEPLVTSRLIIRPFRLEDLEDFHAVFGDPQVMRYIPSGTSADLAASQARLERIIAMQEASGLSLWAVEERASGRVIGDCGLFLVEGKGPDVEVAYHFAQSVWGKGYASEAAQACVRYGFDVLHLPKIVGIINPGNAASGRVLEKAGLKRVGAAWHYNQPVVLFEAVP